MLGLTTAANSMRSSAQMTTKGGHSMMKSAARSHSAGFMHHSRSAMGFGPDRSDM